MGKEDHKDDKAKKHNSGKEGEDKAKKPLLNKNKDPNHKKHYDLESGDKPRVSAENLSEIVSEQDVDAIEKLGGAKGVAGALGTDLEQGLSEEEAKSDNRIQTYGSNKPKKKKQKSYLHFVWEAAQDKTLIILIVCAIISVILGTTVPPREDWLDGTAILVTVAIVILVTSSNDYSKEKKFQKLSELREEKEITVIRGGNQKSVSVYDVVVGDIVELEAGSPIPADGLYISGQNCTSDESPMTGEADSVRKNEESPFLLSGCTILEGVVRMVVIAVGENSQKGKISALLESPNEDTPLTTKLDKLANQIGKFGVVAATLTLLVLIIKFVVDFKKSGKSWEWSYASQLLGYLITAITIVVVAVPEGLPLAVTISLAYSMSKMMKDNNLVRHLEACETMGGATNICSDKTGTLTMNRMTLNKIWMCDEETENEVEVDKNGDVKSKSSGGDSSKKKNKKKDKSSSSSSSGDKEGKNDDVDTIFVNGIALNSNAYVVKKSDGPSEFKGNKTECAMLEYIDQQMGVNYDDLRKKNKSNIVKLYPFSSEKKMMSTVVKIKGESQSKFRVYCKGASEMVLETSASVLNKDGQTSPLDEETKKKLSDKIEEYASEGLRTIGLAYKDIDSEANWEEEDSVVSELVFIGICGIKDPLRKEVPDAVKKCKEAGIIVRMITGDNLLTAKHIAKECGILTEDGEAIEGPKFRKLSESELDKLIPKLQVIARAAPTDKYILVHRLRELGEVVAVTGDGVNDAPQLKEADVGFAMGITGTEVAKDASDIILLDDNFSSIVKAAMWGRNVYDSIRKFVQFQLTVNIVAVLVAFIGAVTNDESPLTAVQLLWVNLIMDTFAALALATERPTEELLQRKPYGRYDSLITRKMWRNIISQVVFQLGVLMFLLYGMKATAISKLFQLPEDNGGSDSKTNPFLLTQNTIIFNTFVFCQLFNEINSRKLGNELNVFQRFFNNPIFLGILAFTVTVQALLVTFGGKFSQTTALNITQWAICVGIGFVSLPLGLLVRATIHPKEPPPKKGLTEKEKAKEEKEKAKKEAKEGKKEGKEGKDESKKGKGKQDHEEASGSVELGKGKKKDDKEEDQSPPGSPVSPKGKGKDREKAPLLKASGGLKASQGTPSGRFKRIASDVQSEVSVINALRSSRGKTSYPIRRVPTVAEHRMHEQQQSGPSNNYNSINK